MRTIDTGIPGLLVIQPTVHGDARGYFMETFREAWFRDHGIDARFVTPERRTARLKARWTAVSW